jgi:hypothetical protein
VILRSTLLQMLRLTLANRSMLVTTQRQKLAAAVVLAGLEALAATLEALGLAAPAADQPRRESQQTPFSLVTR